MEVKRLGIVGTGLIGASVGLAAKRAGVEHVEGFDFSAESLEVAQERGAIDEARASPGELGEADLVLVAVPVTALQPVLRDLLDADGKATVTDAGSTKSNLGEAIGEPRFVGGHPVTGSEAHGPAHATVDLFDGATWFLTPSSATEPQRYRLLHRFVSALRAAPPAVHPPTPEPPPPPPPPPPAPPPPPGGAARLADPPPPRARERARQPGRRNARGGPGAARGGRWIA